MRGQDVALLDMPKARGFDQFRQDAFGVRLRVFIAVDGLHLPEQHAHEEGALQAVIRDDETAAGLQHQEGRGENAGLHLHRALVEDEARDDRVREAFAENSMRLVAEAPAPFDIFHTGFRRLGAGDGENIGVGVDGGDARGGRERPV